MFNTVFIGTPHPQTDLIAYVGGGGGIFLILFIYCFTFVFKGNTFHLINLFAILSGVRFP